MPAAEPTCKIRPKPAPYQCQKPRKKAPKDAPATSAKPMQSNKRENLTLHDWMTVFTFIDNHLDMAQGDIVEHFKTRPEGALIFTQSTLSRKMKNRTELETRTEANPSALLSKCARVVTRPDVERALILWVKHMEEKGETVNGPMLREKRRRFEGEFNVPENERLSGEGWVASFCKAYKIKEYRRHGEAGSVDMAEVEAERIQVQKILAKFAPQDRWNFDETSLFAL